MVLDIATTPDGKHALVASSGYNAHELIVVDLASKQFVDRETVRQSWFGLATDFERGKVWWSGGGGVGLHGLDLRGADLTRTTPSDMTKAAPKARSETRTETTKQIEPEAPRPAPSTFKAGLAFDPASKVLHSLDIDAGTIAAIDTTGAKPDRVASLGGRPNDVKVARNGKMLYVSEWAGRSVLAVSPEDLRVMARIGVGEHPNQIAVHPKADDARIFVA